MKKSNLIDLSIDDSKRINGGYYYGQIQTGFPGQKLLEFVVKSISGAYQAGYDAAIEPCK